MGYKNIDMILKNKDEKLSKELSEYIKDVKIDVFVDNEGLMCSSKLPECNTIFGPNTYSELRSTMDKISTGMDKLANVFAAIPYTAPFYTIFILVTHLMRSQAKSDFVLNDDGKSYRVIGLAYIPIFINSLIINKLTHEELISVCLSRIFDHTQYVREMFRKIDINSKWRYGIQTIIFSLMGIGLSKAANYLKNNPSDYFSDSLLFNDPDFNDPFFDSSREAVKNMELSVIKHGSYTYFMAAAFSILFSFILNKIYYENSNLKSDDFVVKIGRGQSLLSGLKKLKAEYEKNETTFSKLAKAASRFLGFYFDHKITNERISELENKSSAKSGEAKSAIASKAEEVNKNFEEVVKSASDAME